MLREYCEWYDKKLQDLTEHEEEQCREHRYDQDCTTCEDYVLKEYDEEGVCLATIRPDQPNDY